MAKRAVSSLIGGVILVFLGAMILLGSALDIDIWTVGWPFIIIAVGVAMFIAMIARGRGAGGRFAVAGSVIVTAGTILLVENSLRYHQVWSYGWPLMVMAVGVGVLVMGLWDRQASQVRTGAIVGGVGLFLLGINIMTSGHFFIWLDGGEAIGGVVLLLGGLALLLRGRRDKDATAEVEEAKR